MTTETNQNAIVHATDDSFENDVLTADTPVLVDFWAPWCGPCKAIAPLLEEVAQENPNVQIVKVNIDEHNKTATQYNVRAIPTLLLFKNGEVVQTVVGAVRKPDLENLLNS
ncbi:MAG: thioredoxin [Proteobacteria bacterium]|nr:thioredoxin [Pseudomonadota bacterium]MCH9757862.1 thioredoxin [Pseudomonadota bacterium]